MYYNRKTKNTNLHILTVKNFEIVQIFLLIHSIEVNCFRNYFYRFNKVILYTVPDLGEG
jgi:hypothetical protein